MLMYGMTVLCNQTEVICLWESFFTVTNSDSSDSRGLSLALLLIRVHAFSLGSVDF